MSELMTHDVTRDLEFHGDQPMVSSLRVAERFGRQHKDVLDSIRTLLCNLPESQAGRNFPPINDFRSSFEQGTYTDPQNRTFPMFWMTRDGFSLLVMGFTGPEALQWKVRYIAAFNALEQAVKESLVRRLERLESAQRAQVAGLLALGEERRDLMLRVVRYAEMGLVRWEIKRLTGVHKDTVRKLLREAEALGLVRDVGRGAGNKGLDLAARQRILELRGAGLSYAAIAAQVGCTKEAVRGVLRREGAPRGGGQ